MLQYLSFPKFQIGNETVTISIVHYFEIHKSLKINLLRLVQGASIYKYILAPCTKCPFYSIRSKTLLILLLVH